MGGVQVCKMSVCACARLEPSATQFLLQCSCTEVEKSSQTPLACVISCTKNHSRAFQSSFLSCTVAYNPHAAFNICTLCIRLDFSAWSLPLIATHPVRTIAHMYKNFVLFCFFLATISKKKQQLSIHFRWSEYFSTNTHVLIGRLSCTEAGSLEFLIWSETHSSLSPSFKRECFQSAKFS